MLGNSKFIFGTSSSILRSETVKEASMAEKKFEARGKSLIWTKNSRGPKIDPCDMPDEIRVVVEVRPFTKTLCFLLLRYDLNQLIWEFWIPWYDNLDDDIECLTLSKALRRLRNIVRLAWLPVDQEM